MATLNKAVQQMVTNLHAKLMSDTPLSAEEQMLVGKAIEALTSSGNWEQAIIAVAEEHLNTATQALSVTDETLKNTHAALQNSIAQIKNQYGQLYTLSSGSRNIAVQQGRPVVITPPAGCRVRIFLLVATNSSFNTLASYANVSVKVGNRTIGAKIGGATTLSTSYITVGKSLQTDNVSGSSSVYKDIIGRVNEAITLTSNSGTQYVVIGVDFLKQG